MALAKSEDIEAIYICLPYRRSLRDGTKDGSMTMVAASGKYPGTDGDIIRVVYIDGIFVGATLVNEEIIPTGEVN